VGQLTHYQFLGSGIKNIFLVLLGIAIPKMIPLSKRGFHHRSSSVETSIKFKPWPCKTDATVLSER
jgi:hypothetical protein